MFAHPVFSRLSKSLAEFASADANKIKFVFSGDMCVGKNTLQPANVRAVRFPRTASALQQAAALLSKKSLTSLTSSGIVPLTHCQWNNTFRHVIRPVNQGEQRTLFTAGLRSFADVRRCDGSEPIFCWGKTATGSGAEERKK